MPTGAPHRTAGTSRAVRCYNITSGDRAGVNRGRTAHGANSPGACDLRNGRRDWRRSAPLAQPRRGEGAEQQQEADQAGEDRQHADAAHHAGIAHPDAHPAIAAEDAGGAYRYGNPKGRITLRTSHRP